MSSPSSPEIPIRDAVQIRRARRLLDLSAAQSDRELQFLLQIAALHASRSIPEYWYTEAEKIAIRRNLDGKELRELTERLRAEFESEFARARRYGLLTDLRRWEFHWEPLRDPHAFPPNSVIGHGAPMRLCTGPVPNSSVAYTGGNRVVATGSGRRVGRANYYRITQHRFIDPDCDTEAVSLEHAIGEFLDDLPQCIANLMAHPDVAAHIERETSRRGLR